MFVSVRAHHCVALCCVKVEMTNQNPSAKSREDIYIYTRNSARIAGWNLWNLAGDLWNLQNLVSGLNIPNKSIKHEFGKFIVCLCYLFQDIFTRALNASSMSAQLDQSNLGKNHSVCQDRHVH